MLHVWNIYHHLPHKWPNVGKYSIHGSYGYGHGFNSKQFASHYQAGYVMGLWDPPWYLAACGKSNMAMKNMARVPCKT